MSKKNIIFICVAIAVIIVIAFIAYFVVKAINNSGAFAKEKIIIEKYDDEFQLEKVVEITKRKKINELKEKYENPSLEQNEDTQNRVIANNVKVDFTNGKHYMIQLSLPEYCYYEDSNTDTKLVIKMPEGLLEEINDILSKN